MGLHLNNRNSKNFHIVIDYIPNAFLKNLDWVFIQKVINEAGLQFSVEITALVLMDTHLHILVESFKNHENFFVDFICQKISKNDSVETHCEPIEKLDQYLNTYKYIYRNPVVAGLSKNCESYPYSSLPCLLGRQPPFCFYVDRINLVQNPMRILKWLNSNQDYKLSKLKDVRQDNSLQTKSL